MSQKIIVYEGEYNKDILTDDRVAALVSQGYKVKSVSAISVHEKKPTCYLLLENEGEEGDAVAAPKFSVSKNSDGTVVKLALSCATEDATISYSNSLEVPPAVVAYTGPFTLVSGSTITAFATKNGVSSEKAKLDYFVELT